MRGVAGVVVVVIEVMVVMRAVGNWAKAADLPDNMAEQEECCEPRHVHLLLGEAPDQIQVIWSTRSSCHTAHVLYGTSPWRLQSKVKGMSETLADPDNVYSLHYVHRATLTGLEGGTTYFYRPVCNRMGSGPFYFRSPFAHTEWSPQILVTGELGEGSQLLPLLSHRALTGTYNVALQLGGLSTFFSDHNTTSGDQVMQAFQQTAAFLPVMTTPGDYERAGEEPYPVYTHLFPVPGSLWPRPQRSLWYSFDLGPVHFVSICTAVYVHGDQELQRQQQEWLEQDLKEANKERSTRPWIVLTAQLPLHCSPPQHDADCPLVAAGLEDLLYSQGVDLILQSHSQGYQRLYPLYKGLVLSSNYSNPPAPVHLVLGTASSSPSITDVSENPSPDEEGGGVRANSTASQSSGGNSGNSSDFQSSGADGNNSSDSHAVKQGLTRAAVQMVNGTDPTYGRLNVLNATHAHWELLSGRAGKEGEVLDTFWLVQEKHGPFHLSDLPEEVEEQMNPQLATGGGSKPGVVNSHGGSHPLGDMLSDVGSHRQLVMGLSLGAALLLIGMLLIAFILRRRGRRRGVVPRRWDTTDYRYGKTKLSNDVDDDDDDDFKDGIDDMEVSTDDRLQTKRLINRS